MGEEETHPVTLSHQGLAWATAVSLVLASLALVIVILPQAYGLDPTGVGQALGLEPEPSPDPGPLLDAGLVLDPGATTSKGLQLDADQVLYLEWRADPGLNFTLRGAGGDAVTQGTLHATQAPATWWGQQLTIEAAGTYVLTWSNENATEATGHVWLTESHAHGEAP